MPEKCMERILLLDGAPNMTDYFKINIGQTVKQQLQNDLDLEYAAVKRLNDGIKASRGCGRQWIEGTTWRKFCSMRNTTSIGWKAQLHMIKEMTYENYLAQQLGEGEES